MVRHLNKNAAGGSCKRPLEGTPPALVGLNLMAYLQNFVPDPIASNIVEAPTEAGTVVQLQYANNAATSVGEGSANIATPPGPSTSGINILQDIVVPVDSELYEPISQASDIGESVPLEQAYYGYEQTHALDHSDMEQPVLHLPEDDAGIHSNAVVDQSAVQQIHDNLEADGEVLLLRNQILESKSLQSGSGGQGGRHHNNFSGSQHLPTGSLVNSDDSDDDFVKKTKIDKIIIQRIKPSSSSSRGSRQRKAVKKPKQGMRRPSRNPTPVTVEIIKLGPTTEDNTIQNIIALQTAMPMPLTPVTPAAPATQEFKIVGKRGKKATAKRSVSVSLPENIPLEQPSCSNAILPVPLSGSSTLEHPSCSNVAVSPPPAEPIQYPAEVESVPQVAISPPPPAQNSSDLGRDVFLSQPEIRNISNNSLNFYSAAKAEYQEKLAAAQGDADRELRLAEAIRQANQELAEIAGRRIAAEKAEKVLRAIESGLNRVGR